MGTTEFFVREIVGNAPQHVYFLVVGSIFALVLNNKQASMLWAFLTAAAAMCIYALTSHHIYFQSMTYLDIGILFNLYALPLVFAVGGALAVNIITDRKKPNDNTET